MKKRTGSFKAVDSDGDQYTICIYSDCSGPGNSQGANLVIKGMNEFKTSEGMVVERHQKGEYEIVQTGIILHSVFPDAP